MSPATFFITGTDTGVGKTVLTALLVRHLLDGGVRARAVKPLGSGGRADARLLAAAQDDALPLDEINPWHFRAPLTPLIAARLENRLVSGAGVRRYLRGQQRLGEVLLVEGAGGLLSPLGADFDARDLIAALRATPVVVCPNRLGAINQSLLTLAALSREARLRAKLVLVTPRRPEASSVTNAELLRERLGVGRVVELPHLAYPLKPARSLRSGAVRAAVEAILRSSGQGRNGCVPLTRIKA